MKRLLLTYSLVLIAPFFLASCGKSNKQEDPDQAKIKTDNNIKHEGNTKMTRTKTASGLEYEIIHEGTGETPKKGQLVTVNYTGWLNVNGEKGTKFDSSFDRNQPFVFPIGMGHVIKGWDEGVISMKPGEKRLLFIPSELGYGARGAGAIIPGNANLIFEVDLIKAT